MDTLNFKRINQSSFDERVEFINYGLWDKKETVSFIENKRGSEIIEDGKNTAKCISLDEAIGEQTITFIKMDIEGAEQNALRGASSIIKRDKPKLAICLYHKLEDLWEIPFYVHSLVPEYKLYIRHHSNSNEETVLYTCI